MTDELVQRLGGALEKLKLWERFEGMESVGAFALCTDDSLTTLFACAAPANWLATHQDVLFWPPDFPMEDEGDEALEAPWEVLDRRYRAALLACSPCAPGEEDISAHVETSFMHLVDSLASLRAEQFFAPETILMVCGTTPTPTMLRHASRAVSRLNNDRVVSQWNDHWKHQLPESEGQR